MGAAFSFAGQKASDAFRALGITSLEHMTHRENVEAICKEGILNHYDARKKHPYDISNPDVQDRRERKEPVYHRRIHEYAPLYINPRNPMLYANLELQESIYIIKVSLEVLDDMPFLFTDGNAAADMTGFLNETDDLDKLPMDVLKSRYWNDFVDGRRKMCAEVLIYDHIPAEYIEKVYCISPLAKLLAPECNKPVEVDSAYYF